MTGAICVWGSAILRPVPAPLRVAVVGGGIIGTAVAQLLATRHDAEVTLLEKEDRLAGHQTGHNSGVVHAGLYYEPGSLKARLCRRGGDLLAEFVDRHSIAHERRGKVVVALDGSELGRLDALHDRARANGVPGLRLLAGEELRELEPAVAGLRALHSPHTWIVDFPAVTRALGEELVEAGGRIRLSAEVTSMSQRDVVRVDAGGETSEHDLVVVCGGLQSDRLAAMVGEPRSPRIVPFFGDYFEVGPAQRDLVGAMVYPVPDPRYPFLGVHLTPTVDGRLTLGPNAFLSLARERYRRHGGASARDLAAAVGFPGFWRFAAGNLPAAVRESRTALSGRRFVAEAARYAPDLDAGAVTWSRRGVRAQAMDARGRLVDDFVITGNDKVVLVRNAPSPGATSALAIAEHVVEQALARR